MVKRATVITIVVFAIIAVVGIVVAVIFTRKKGNPKPPVKRSETGGGGQIVIPSIPDRPHTQTSVAPPVGGYNVVVCAGDEMYVSGSDDKTIYRYTITDVADDSYTFPVNHTHKLDISTATGTRIAAFYLGTKIYIMYESNGSYDLYSISPPLKKDMNSLTFEFNFTPVTYNISDAFSFMESVYFVGKDYRVVKVDRSEFNFSHLNDGETWETTEDINLPQHLYTALTGCVNNLIAFTDNEFYVFDFNGEDVTSVPGYPKRINKHFPLVTL